jgi:hypothetical protein
VANVVDVDFGGEVFYTSGEYMDCISVPIYTASHVINNKMKTSSVPLNFCFPVPICPTQYLGSAPHGDRAES